ncbi:MAG: hypothetical protein Q8M37_10775 [Nevskia sp.]|nr:hypothetical protein [Nevskia sp.]
MSIVLTPFARPRLFPKKPRPNTIQDITAAEFEQYLNRQNYGAKLRKITVTNYANYGDSLPILPRQITVTAYPFSPGRIVPIRRSLIASASPCSAGQSSSART